MIFQPHFNVFFGLLLSFPSYVLAIPNTTCYAPSGEAIGELDIQPCIQISGIDSMCCATNRTFGADICMTNGLCQNGGNDPTYWRDYCTDPTWSSPNCLSKTVCGDTAFSKMTLCIDGTWCCGVGNDTGCCDIGLGFKLTENLVQFKESDSAGTGTSSLLPVSIMPAATSASLSRTPSALAASVSPSAPGDGIDPRTVIGLGVGLGVIAVLGVVGGFLAGLRKGKSLERIMNNKLIRNDSGVGKVLEEGAERVVYREVYEMQGM